VPIHENLGDQAIFMAENNFIKKHFPKSSILAIRLVVSKLDKKILHFLIKKNDIILGLGGGNFGDAYVEEEKLRRFFVNNFSDNRIIIFPQTIHFSDSQSGRQELAKSISVYSRHNNLSLIAREEHSYQLMRKYFNHNVILLTPDIVLSLNIINKSYKRKGIKICLRNDQESLLSHQDKLKINRLAIKYNSDISFIDTISKIKFYFLRNKSNTVKKKLYEFSTAELVITDRLHGMVFSAITGTPCVVFSNYNHKVTGTYRWLYKLPYIYYCTDINNLEQCISKVYRSDVYKYDPIVFNKYWKRIVKLIS